MNNTGPNTRIIFDSVVLFGTIVIFAILFLLRKRVSAKSNVIKEKENQRLFSYSRLIALILFLLTFLVFFIINNKGQ